MNVINSKFGQQCARPECIWRPVRGYDDPPIHAAGLQHTACAVRERHVRQFLHTKVSSAGSYENTCVANVCW